MRGRRATESDVSASCWEARRRGSFLRSSDWDNTVVGRDKRGQLVSVAFIFIMKSYTMYTIKRK